MHSLMADEGPKPARVEAEAPKQETHYEFQAPERAIFSQADLTAFCASETCQDLLRFVKLLSLSVKGKPISAECKESETLRAICEVLHEMEGWIDEFPPLEQPMRFGNKAFRSWHQRLLDRSEDIMRRILPGRLHGAVVELAPYIGDAFGNQTRIDYGTGHETTFVFWMCCLFKLGVITAEDMQAVVTRAFQQYLVLVRKLQKTYNLEPAGSHGVWSLDDYQMLPFYFGASQLIGHDMVKPSSIHDHTTVEMFADDYMYLACIRFIKQMKSGGHFGEYAPMLNDVSGLPSWSKIASGMLKLYQGEVIGKLPVIQHFRFGSIMPCTWTPSRTQKESYGNVAPPPPPVGGVTARAPWAMADGAAPPAPPSNPGAGEAPMTVAPWAKKAESQ